MAAWLATQGYHVNRKRVQRLMRRLGLAAIYQRPNTSKPAAAHKIYPYLLRGLAIERLNQVWCSDVTYIPIAKGFLHLVVIIDWVSRTVLAWRLSNTLDADFCVEALEDALSRYGRPEIFNTDQGILFTHGQHLCRATVAQPQIRGGLPSRLCDSGRSQGRHWRLAGILQPGAPAPEPRLSHAAADLPGGRVDMWRSAMPTGCASPASRASSESRETV
jgi:hypothetical protein